MKKIISICLTICMLLSMVSALSVSAAPAFAGSYNSADGAYKNGYVSTVENIKAAIRNGADAVAGVDYQASSSAPWGDNGAFTLIAGDWAYINVDMPYTGVYVMQFRTDWANGYPAVYHVTTEEGYAAEYNITSNGWSSGCNQDQLIYLNQGVNTVKVSLVGNNNATISSIDFGALNASGADKSLDYLPLVKLADDLVVPTPEPTPTPKPYYPADWDGVVENHPDYDANNEVLYFDAYSMNMSSDEGTELFGTDWGLLEASSTIPNKGQANAIYLAPGAAVTYTVTVAEEGVYGAQVKASSAEGETILQMSNNVNGTEYISQHNIPNRGTWVTTWSNASNFKGDDLIYLQAGANNITITNVGNYGVTYENNDFGKITDSMKLLEYVGTIDNPAGVDPEGWDGMVDEFEGFAGYDGSIGALNYNEYIVAIPYTETGFDLEGVWVKYTVTAPEAGMYLVYATSADDEGTATLTSDALDYVTFDFSDFIPAYIYLNEGDNVITVTGDVDFTAATFYQLNNSDSYLDQNKNENDVPEFASDISVRPYSDRTNDSGFYQYGAYEAVVQYAGSSMTYDVKCNFPGIYRVQAKIGGTMSEPYPIVTIDTDGDEGYRAQIATTYADDWGAWRATGADGESVYVYLKEGINKVSVTAGGTHHVLWALEFKLLSEEEEATITMDDLTKTPPSDIVINPYTDSLSNGGKGYDFYSYAADAPVIGNVIGCQLLSGCWQRFEVTASVAGYYQVFTTAAVYGSEATIAVETKDSIAKVSHPESPDNYRTIQGGTVYLEEGVNSVWVQNLGGGWMYLQKITLSYLEDASAVLPGAFVQGHNFIGAPDDLSQIEKYTVRNNYYGIHVADTADASANTLTYQYAVTIPADDYYGIIMTGTVPLTPHVKITMDDGVNAEVVMLDGELPYFGNQDQSASVTITPDKVYLPAGEYTMTFTYTENKDAGTNGLMMTHVHSFEFTTLTRQDLFLAAMQSAETTADIAAALEEFEDVLTSDITVTPETDFIYPEYAYNALLNCAMLETGAYETYEDIKTAYNFAKDMITVADDGTGSLVYTVQVGDWNEIGTTVLVAVYAGDQLYMMGEGYLDYEEAVGTYVPVEATLYDYVPEDGDVIKLFVWDSLDGLKPVF